MSDKINKIELVKALNTTMEYRTPEQHELIRRAAGLFLTLMTIFEAVDFGVKKK